MILRSRVSKLLEEKNVLSNMKKTKQRETWKQNTSAEQLIELFGCIEGHFSNWADGLTNDMGFALKMTKLLEEQRELLYFVEHPEKWVPLYGLPKKK